MSANAPLPNPDADLVTALQGVFADLPGPFRSLGGVRTEWWDAALLDPARYVLSRPGKGIRARTLERSWELAGGEASGPPELLPVVIELLHVGSLIVDDIEDDSRTRRGRPALHRRFGLPLALNTGNWLYFAALTVLSRSSLPPDVRLALYEHVSVALMRCHQGQALDLSTRITSIRRSDVPGLVDASTRLKTGSLMELSASMGARAAGGSPAATSAIGAFGLELGVGLQMLDDWSGIAVEARREKGREDVRLARPTWPWAWLAARADEFSFMETVRQAREISVEWEADRVVDRLRLQLADVAPVEIGAQLAKALARLQVGLPEGCDLAAVRDDLDELRGAFG